MLLPSALPCSPRPTQPRFAPYGSLFSPPPTPTATTATSATTATPFQHTYASPITTTCRALQSLLGVSAPRHAAPPATTRFGPRAQEHHRETPQRCRAQVQAQSPQTPPRKQRPRPSPLTLAIQPSAHRIHKRSYSALASPSADQENLPLQPSTPKRQRRAPAIIPRGLSNADFEALEPATSNCGAPSEPAVQRLCTRAKVVKRTARTCEAATTASIPDLSLARGEAFVATVRFSGLPHSSTIETASPSASSSSSFSSFAPTSPHHADSLSAQTATVASEDASTSASSADWTSTDDLRLLALVLDKLQLSRRDWDDCARVLGGTDDGASLGRRWDALVGEGRVGMCLRRGDGRKRGAVGEMFGSA